MQNRDQMHPSDIRNLLIFAALSVVMWLGYDHFIARPQAEAMRAAAQQAAQIRAAVEASAPAEILDTAIVKPRDEIIAETGRVLIETPTLTGSINLKGGRLDDVRLKDYYKTIEKKDRVDVLSPARTASPRYVETGWIGSKEFAGGLPGDDTVWRLKGDAGQKLTPSTPVTLIYTNRAGFVFEKIFTVDEDFAFSIEDKVTNPTGNSVVLHPYALATEHGIPEDMMNRGPVHEGPIGYIGESLIEKNYKDFKKKPEESITADSGWIGLTTKYWLTALAPAVQGEEDAKYRFVSSPAINERTKDRYQTDITGAPREVAAGSEASYKVNVFAGAKKVRLLGQYEKEWNVPNFDLAVDFGWFYFLTKPFFIALSFLYDLTGNFGIAIIIFTCVLRVFVFPLANTSYKSFAKLRQVSPEMYELRHKYKDDKQKLQQELVGLYQRNNVNPAAGCLPIIVQIPIFFALYKVLSNTIEMRHAPFFGWIQDLSVKDPTSVFNLFGLLPYDVPAFMAIGAWPCMMLLAMIIQKNISPPPDDPIQARLIAIMPWFMTYVMSGFAAGLVIYWTVNNVLAVIQQIIIMRSMGVPVHLFSKDKDKEKLEKEIKEGPNVSPTLELLEEQVEHALHPDEGPKEISPPKPKKKKKK
ncbi:MAG: membrane protein insertase YidC [Micavibrio sp.]